MSITYDLINNFNKSVFRKKMIPQEVSAGWPCIIQAGSMICMTIPYYRYALGEDKKINLYPIYCSVTIPVKNPERLIDFTIYPYQKSWADIDYDKACGVFKHAAIENLNKREYTALRDELFECYDELIAAIEEKRAPKSTARMKELMGKLMEPGLAEQYKKINKAFYGAFYE